jgi:hypothetical protein
MPPLTGLTRLKRSGFRIPEKSVVFSLHCGLPRCFLPAQAFSIVCKMLHYNGFGGSVGRVEAIFGIAV